MTARLCSRPLADIEHLKVSNKNPPSNSEDGLDFDRCSAFHNAIVKHRWQASGYYLATLPATTGGSQPNVQAN